jgi:hypothetical protein
MRTISRVKNNIILFIGISFLCFFILNSYAFASEIDDFNKEYKFR